MEFAVSNVLGEARQIQSLFAWSEDGINHVAYTCPFCGSAVHNVVKCENPACEASRYANADVVRANREKAAQAKAEREWQARRHQEAMERIRQEQQERNQRFADIGREARDRGACVHCALKSADYSGNNPRFIKHRGECTKQRNAA